MWSRIEDGYVVEITDIDPTERFHPDLVWQACPVEVRPGWTVVGDEFTPPPEYTSEPLPSVEREWRDLELASTEWLVTRHRDEQDQAQGTTLTATQFSELLAYRQALRDWPQSPSFPDGQYRPPAPEWLAEQAQ